MIKIYFNSKCSKCRTAKEYLEKNNYDFKIFEYLEKPFSKKDIREILQKGNLSIEDILRKNEPKYLEHIKNQNLSENEIIKLIIEHPKILQRPIIVSKETVIIARDEENLKKIINSK